MNTDLNEFIRNNNQELFDLLEKLCRIPAPSGQEHKRALFCKEWLEKNGAKGVYIDDAINVIVPMNCEKSDEISVFVAHTDTVFSETEEMLLTDEGDILRCPGICDDTASLAVLLISVKYFIENKIRFPKGALFVCNSCEEGLGNLRGTRQIFKDYANRISQFISFDSLFEDIANRCVGSHRYKITVSTEGGHSYLAFGKKNAIHELSKMVDEIYKIDVPVIGDSKTTYNVGIISGGTSVNTIAQQASMVCEYRSDNVQCLEKMKTKFYEIFDAARTEETEVAVEVVGERPCMMDMDTREIDRMYVTTKEIIEAVTGQKVRSIYSSTDCNIPLSLGIPSLCVGVCDGGGRHTREEWLIKSSLPKGLEIGIKIIMDLAQGAQV